MKRLPSLRRCHTFWMTYDGSPWNWRSMMSLNHVTVEAATAPTSRSVAVSSRTATVVVVESPYTAC